MTAGLFLAAALQIMPIEAAPFPALGEPRRAGCLVLRQGLTLSGPDALGGYSAIEVVPKEDGTATLLLVSDTGRLLSLEAALDEKGDVISVSSGHQIPIGDKKGDPLSKATGDAESLARTGGQLVIGFEGRDRLSIIDGGRETASYRAPRGDEAILGRNSGYEALAALTDGTLVAISEGKNEAGLSRMRRGTLGDAIADWTATAYRPAADFNPTGADLDEATGDLFVLERAFSRLKGPRARIVRVPEAEIGAPLVEGETVARLGFLEGVDNMEGIDVRRGPEGSLLVTLISDDNFSDAQRTVLMSLALSPACEHGEAAEAAAGHDAPAKAPIDE